MLILWVEAQWNSSQGLAVSQLVWYSWRVSSQITWPGFRSSSSKWDLTLSPTVPIQYRLSPAQIEEAMRVIVDWCLSSLRLGNATLKDLLWTKYEIYRGIQSHRSSIGIKSYWINYHRRESIQIQIAPQMKPFDINIHKRSHLTFCQHVTIQNDLLEGKQSPLAGKLSSFNMQGCMQRKISRDGSV